MTRRSTLLRLAAPVALATLLGAATTSAQRCDGKALSPEQIELRSRIASTLGRQAIDYWVPKLNTYREQIDRTLSPTDLATLRRLRVRWAILIDEGIKDLTEKEENGTSRKRAERGSEVTSMQEIMEIFMAAKEIAGRYRPQMDALGERLVGDVGGFGEEMRRNVDEFAHSNRVMLEADPEIGSQMLNGSQMDTIAASLRSEKTKSSIRSAYPMILEPIIMLFDGGELLSMIQRAVPGMNIAKATGGVELPASSALRQNFPNPASGETTIPFVLNEPATAVTLRLYNGQGDAVRTVEIGGMAAGEQTQTIDVAGLPAGSYLYHLTMTGASGTRVHSKAMQVVR